MARVTFEKKGHIGYVTLNNPPVNAFSNDMYAEVGEQFRRIDEMDDVYVVILRAESKVFCAGNEVSEFSNFNDPEKIISGGEIVSDSVGAIFNCKKPVIAAVHGHAFGAGFALQAACDFVIAAEKALFCMAEIKVGIIAAGEFAALHLPVAVAKYMCLTGEPMPAAKMKEYGAIWEVVPKEQVLPAAEALAEKLIAVGPLTVGLFKQAFNENLDARLKEKYMHEVTEYTAKYYATHDFKEAIAAFIEKRPPVYTGN